MKSTVTNNIRQSPPNYGGGPIPLLVQANWQSSNLHRHNGAPVAICAVKRALSLDRHVTKNFLLCKVCHTNDY